MNAAWPGACDGRRRPPTLGRTDENRANSAKGPAFCFLNYLFFFKLKQKKKKRSKYDGAICVRLTKGDNDEPAKPRLQSGNSRPCGSSGPTSKNINFWKRGFFLSRVSAKKNWGVFFAFWGCFCAFWVCFCAFWGCFCAFGVFLFFARQRDFFSGGSFEKAYHTKTGNFRSARLRASSQAPSPATANKLFGFWVLAGACQRHGVGVF